jgi:uncharacterized membrane protein YgcG
MASFMTSVVPMQVSARAQTQTEHVSSPPATTKHSAAQSSLPSVGTTTSPSAKTRIRSKRTKFASRKHRDRLKQVLQGKPPAATSPYLDLRAILSVIGDKYIGRRLQILQDGTVVVTYEPSKYCDFVMPFEIVDAQGSIVRCYVRCHRNELFRLRSDYFEAVFKYMPERSLPVDVMAKRDASASSSFIASSSCSASSSSASSSASSSSASSSSASSSSASSSSASSSSGPSEPRALDDDDDKVDFTSRMEPIGHSELHTSVPKASNELDRDTFSTIACLVQFWDWMFLGGGSTKLSAEVTPSCTHRDISLDRVYELYFIAQKWCCLVQLEKELVTGKLVWLAHLPPLQQLKWGMQFQLPYLCASGADALLAASREQLDSLTPDELKVCAVQWHKRHVETIGSGGRGGRGGARGGRGGGRGGFV